MGKKINIGIYIFLLIGIVFAQREFFPKIETTDQIEYAVEIDSTYIKEVEKLREDNIKLIGELNARPIPKIKIIKVPQYIDTVIHDTVTIQLEDGFTFEDCINDVNNVVYKDTCINNKIDSIYHVEDFLLYNKYRKHKIKLNRDYFERGDTILPSEENDVLQLTIFKDVIIGTNSLVGILTLTPSTESITNLSSLTYTV